jgi:transcriptional regulator with XRE-family HTH domain
LGTDQKEIQVTEGEILQQVAPQAPQSLGTLLKAERERLGLSLEQVTEKTRMRAQVIEAIENEAWGSLPPPVYVRGFLRSYAKMLRLSQEQVIDLYAKCAPPESPVQIPHLEPSANRRRRAWPVLLILAVVAVVYAMSHFYPSSQVTRGPREAEKKHNEAASAPSHPAVASPPPVRPSEEPVKQEAATVQSPSQEAPITPQEGEGPARDQANDGEGWLSLSGIVKERTWLRITIDGKEEKEYLFQTGARPRWRAKQKFHVFIGNAGGIDFELNGKRVGPLGKPGQVVRLTLPEDVGQLERAN